MKSIIIFGGAGYIGKHIILKLSKLGYKIIVPYQKPLNEPKLRLLGTTGQIVPFHYTSLKDQKILTLLNKASICINLKTSWDTKKRTYKESIFDFNVELISILNNNNFKKKYIYFSGLGLNEISKSLRSRAILDSENHIINNYKNSNIIRPSIILGKGDQFLSNLLKFFKISFFIPLFVDGNKKFQPVHIEDVCNLVLKCIRKTDSSNKIIELGGPNVFSYKEFYNLIAKKIGKKRVFVPIPMMIAKILIGIINKTPFSPLNLDQLSLFDQNNVVSGSHLDFEHYNMVPQNVSKIITNSL